MKYFSKNIVCVKLLLTLRYSMLLGIYGRGFRCFPEITSISMMYTVLTWKH